MKHQGVISLLFSLVAVVAIVGAYLKGRNDVWIAEFKQYQANMLTLTHWETNHPPELREFVKAHYYYSANRTPKSWVGRPYDYGSVSTNIIHLTGFKGPTSAQEEYRLFLERFATTKQTP
jgi:hypothetical protein